MSSSISEYFVTNYQHIMSQTQNKKQKESESHSEPNLIIKNKQAFLPNHTLLICNGAGTILFAWGDPKVLEHKFDNLQYHNLFELGFSQTSLNLLKQSIKGGLLQNDVRLKCTLEFVRSSNGRSNFKQQFNSYKNRYIKKIALKCSVIFAKFGQYPPASGQSKIKRQPVVRLNPKEKQKAFVLVQADADVEATQLHTSYQDYIFTFQKMPGVQRLIAKIEKSMI